MPISTFQFSMKEFNSNKTYVNEIDITYSISILTNFQSKYHTTHFFYSVARNCELEKIIIILFFKDTIQKEIRYLQEHVIHTSNVLLKSEIGVIGGLNIVLASMEAKCGGVGVFVFSPRID